MHLYHWSFAYVLGIHTKISIGKTESTKVGPKIFMPPCGDWDKYDYFPNQKEKPKRIEVLCTYK